MTRQIAICPDTHALLGEGIIWDERRQSLFWVDIKNARLFETDPHEMHSREWIIEGDVGGTIGCIAVDYQSDGFLAATGQGFVRLQCENDSRTAKVDLLIDPEAHLPSNRFNDGALDPFGGFWAGSMDDEEKEVAGSWWRLNGEGVVQLVDGFKVTNGPAFLREDEGQCFVFLTDSAASTVYKAAYSEEGGVGPLSKWAQFDEAMGYPDGMCMDNSGRLWVAFWDGGAIRAYDPTSPKVCGPIETVHLPVRRPTKMAFTPDGDCFVTSASIGLGKTGVDGAIVKICGLSHSTN